MEGRNEVKQILEPNGEASTTAAGGGAHPYQKPLRSFRWHDIQYLLMESFDSWSKHKAPRLGAALAFYSLLSLTPLLLVTIAIVGLVFGHSTAQRETVRQVQMLVRPQGAKAVDALLQGSRKESSRQSLA